MKNYLLDIVKSQKQGDPIGVYAVCSSNKYVLKASLHQAYKDNSFILVEPTANQVNQYGGYTGMRPDGFVNFLFLLADEIGFSREKIVLGGDHLGPNPWRDEPAEEAMKKSKELVRKYVEAGFTKIHLDTSIPCADDNVERGMPMDDRIVAQRAVELCKIAEDTYKKYKNTLTKPVYVIGTEVPIPGGAEGELHKIEVTSVASARNTLEVTKNAFLQNGLEDTWSRVIAQVVQPGVEFGNSEVVEYDPDKASDLSGFIKNNDSKIFEAHSTDFQSFECLRNLVKDQFAILKVGPWLTYAFREAVFSLSYIEEEYLFSKKKATLSNLRSVLDEVMCEAPRAWETHYNGNESKLKFLRKYSYSDRSRYYWQNLKVEKALKQLFSNFKKHTIPMPLLSQFFPIQYHAIQNGYLENTSEKIVLHKIQEITELYSRATNQRELTA